MIYSIGFFNVIFLEVFGESKQTTAWMGAVQVSLQCLLGPLSGLMNEYLGPRITVMIGGLVTSAGFALTYFATSFGFLFFSFGILVGIGIGFSYVPVIVIIGLYFKRYRNLAYGVTAATVGIGCMVLPPIIIHANESYGWRGCMLIMSGISLHHVLCGALYRPQQVPSDMEQIDTENQDSWMEPDDIANKTSLMNHSMTNQIPEPDHVTNHMSELDCSMANQKPEQKYTTSENLDQDYATISKLEQDCFANKKMHLDYLADDLRSKHHSGSISSCRSESAFLEKKNLKKSQMESQNSYQNSLRELPIKNGNTVNDWSTTGHHVISVSKLNKSLRGITRDEDKHHPNRSSPLTLLDLPHLKEPMTVSTSSLVLAFTADKPTRHIHHRMKQNVSKSLSAITSHRELLHEPAIYSNSHDAIGTYPHGVSEKVEAPPMEVPLVSSDGKYVTRKKCSVLRNGKLICLFINLLCVNGGSFISYLHFPAYFILQGATEAELSFLMVLVGISSIVSRILVGIATNDKDMSVLLMYFSTGGIAAVIFLLCPVLSQTSMGRILFALGFGFFNNTYCALNPPLALELCSLSELNTAFSINCLMMGISSLLSPPLAGWLYDISSDYRISFYYAGVQYMIGSLILMLIPLIEQRESANKGI